MEEKNTMIVEQMMNKKILRQHSVACWLAVFISIAWAVINYFTIFHKNGELLVVNLISPLLILLTILAKDKIMHHPQLLGMIPVVLIAVSSGYTYSQLDLEHFQEYTFVYVALFIGAGMFLLWKMKYSIATFVIFAITNLMFFNLFSSLAIETYLSNGGVLVLSVSVFMIIAIEVRYSLTRNEVMANIALKESREQLSMSEKQHVFLFNANPVPMLIFSLDTMKILAVNSKLVSKYGYSRQEFIGMHISQLGTKDEAKKYEDSMEEARSWNDEDSEWKHVLKDGTEIDVEIVARTINYFGEIARLVSITDITQIKSYQEELIEAKQKADQARDLQREFLSNMSHEIRTPMNGIIGMTDLLLKTELTKEQKEQLNIVKVSSRNLMNIINEILDFSKVEAGKMKIESVEFNLKEQLWNLKSLMEVRAKEKGIELECKIHEGVPENLIGDPIRFNQILMNLIANAIKFTKDGFVSVVVECLEEKENEVSLQFKVEDTGVGIPADKLQQIFSSFTQASDSTTREFGGTGLGLTISKQLIELQGGRIWVDSQVGLGSQFCFVLSFGKAKDSIVDFDDKEEYDEEKILNKLGNVNVLLVEDHNINQMLATTVLKRWNFNVDLAENGLEAVEKVKENNYDIVLMDISMPKMDGYEATKCIRKLEKNKNGVPIIAMTASAFISDNDKCFEVGMNDYLAKPFDSDNLLQKITTQIMKKSA